MNWENLIKIPEEVFIRDTRKPNRTNELQNLVRNSLIAEVEFESKIRNAHERAQSLVVCSKPKMKIVEWSAKKPKEDKAAIAYFHNGILKFDEVRLFRD
jgi:hypothetical protein